MRGLSDGLLLVSTGGSILASANVQAAGTTSLTAFGRRSASVPRQKLTLNDTLTCRGGGRFFSPHPYNRVPQGVRGNSLASAAPTNKPMPQQTENFAERWNVIANPGAEHTEQAFTDFIRGCGQGRKVLNCAVPLARARPSPISRCPLG